MSTPWIRILALSTIAEFCILCPQPIVRPAEAAPPPGYSLVWSDEFTGTTLDTNKWGYRQPGVCRHDAINIQDAVSVGNGLLTLTTYTGADGKHYTGMIQTGGASWGPIVPPEDKKLVRYGYIEARIDFDGSPGMWSSFWLQSPTYGNPLSNPRTAGTEIDIVEHRVIGSSPGQPDQNIQTQAPSALHWDAYYPNAAAKSAGGDLHSGNGALSTGFHTYGLEWTPDVLRFYYDCVLVWTVNNSQQLDPPSPPGSQSPSVLGPVSQANEFIILSSEVQNNGAHVCPSLCKIQQCDPGDPPAAPGGWCGTIPTDPNTGNPGFGSLTGAPGVASTTKVKVDYVRVYQDVVPPATVQNLSVSTPYGRTTMAVSWTAPGDDGTGKTATKYDLRYSTSQINASNFNSATYVTSTGAPHAAGFPECFVITGLSECTPYYFAIKTMDEAGNWSAISNVPSATTECDINRTATCPTVNPDMIAPGNVFNLSVSDTGNATAAVSWTAPGDDGASGKASEYDLRYSLSSIDGTNFGSAARVTIAAPKVAGSAECAVVRGLCASTPYYFAIKTKDEWGNWSGIGTAPVVPTSSQSKVAECSLGGGVAKQPVPNEDSDDSPRLFSAPRPNPAHGRTSFSTLVPSESQGAKLHVGVFDIQGRRVRTLVNRTATLGPAQIEWNLLDDSGHRVASGLYMVRVDVGDVRKTFRLVVVR